MNSFLIFGLLVGIGAGIIGPVYRHVLAYEPILNWWFKIGSRYEMPERWFFKPVWACEKCVSGQLAFWFSLVIYLVHGVPGRLIPVVILATLTAICTAVLVAIFITKKLKSVE